MIKSDGFCSTGSVREVCSLLSHHLCPSPVHRPAEDQAERSHQQVLPCRRLLTPPTYVHVFHGFTPIFSHHFLSIFFCGSRKIRIPPPPPPREEYQSKPFLEGGHETEEEKKTENMKEKVKMMKYREQGSVKGYNICAK
jgi:hypothetical protein